MEYHNQLIVGQHHFQQSQQQQQHQQSPYSHLGGNSNGMQQGQSFPIVPDGSSSSEKALMWSGQYLPESGYSTQAPSISSHDSYMHQQSVVYSQQTAVVVNEPMSGDNNKLAAEPEQDNNVANWMNSQDNLEMALKAVPDLLKLLLDEDMLVVQQSAIILNQMSRMDTPRQALILTADLVACICDCLCSTTDIDTVKNLVGALYGLSTQKPEGVQVICRSNALGLLIKMLAAPIESIVSYAITTIHNVLLDCGDAVKSEMRKAGAVHHLIPLLSHNQNAKFLAIVVDCLYSLVLGNQEAKMFVLEMGGTQQLIAHLFNHTQQYPKLILNIIRLLKVLSVCSNNKQALLSMNAIQPLSSHLMASASSQQSMGGSGSSSISRDIMQNCLMTLRNLSDAATQLPGLAPFITSLLSFVSTSQDSNHIEMAAAILANLTVNEANKIAAIKSNAIPILLKLISHYSGITSNTQQPKIVDPCMCALRHLTIRHAETYLAQEQVRSCNGLSIIASVMRITPRHWGVTKAVLGVVRNFATNQFNSDHMRQYEMISNLMTILFEAVNLINHKTNGGKTPAVDVKQDGINLYEIVETSSASLLLLAKETVNKIIMRNLDCIGFFVQMFYSPLVGIQRPAASILAELATARECAIVIEQQPGFHEFVQSNFCNQFGQLMNLSANANNNGNVNVLQYVTAIMEKLQDHRSKSIAFY